MHPGLFRSTNQSLRIPPQSHWSQINQTKPTSIPVALQLRKRVLQRKAEIVIPLRCFVPLDAALLFHFEFEVGVGVGWSPGLSWDIT